MLTASKGHLIFVFVFVCKDWRERASNILAIVVAQGNEWYCLHLGSPKISFIPFCYTQGRFSVRIFHKLLKFIHILTKAKNALKTIVPWNSESVKNLYCHLCQKDKTAPINMEDNGGRKIYEDVSFKIKKGSNLESMFTWSLRI